MFSENNIYNNYILFKVLLQTPTFYGTVLGEVCLFTGYYSWWDTGRTCKVTIMVLMMGGSQNDWTIQFWTYKEVCACMMDWDTGESHNGQEQFGRNAIASG